MNSPPTSSIRCLGVNRSSRSRICDKARLRNAPNTRKNLIILLSLIAFEVFVFQNVQPFDQKALRVIVGADSIA